MNKIKKQGLSSIIFLFIGLLLGFVNSAVLFPKTLGIAVFGFIKWLNSIGVIFEAIIGSGSYRIAIRFFPYFSDDKQTRDGFFTFLITFSLLLASFSGLILFLFEDIILKLLSSEKDNLLSHTYFYLLYILICLKIIQQGLSGYVTAMQKPRFVDFFTWVINPIIVLALLSFYYFQVIGEASFLELYAFRTFVIIVAILFYLHRFKLASLKSFSTVIKKSHLKSIGKFWLFTTFSGVSSVIIHRVDLLMIAAFLNFSQTGIYAVFYTIASIIMIPHQGLRRISSPIIAEMWKNKDLAKIENIYKKTTLNNFIVGLLIFVGICINIDTFIVFMGDEYIDGKYVAIVIGLVQLINVAFGYNDTILYHSPKYNFVLISQFFALIVTIVTNYLLIPIFGILGAAMATAATLFTVNSITQIFIGKVFKIHPFSWNMFYAICFAAMMMMVNELIPTITYHFVLDVLLRSFIISVLYALLVVEFKLSPDINALLLSLYRKVGKQ